MDYEGPTFEPQAPPYDPQQGYGYDQPDARQQTNFDGPYANAAPQKNLSDPYGYESGLAGGFGSADGHCAGTAECGGRCGGCMGKAEGMEPSAWLCTWALGSHFF